MLQRVGVSVLAGLEGVLWLLPLFCCCLLQPVSPKEQGATRALQLLKRSLGDVLEVLLPAYGPGVAQQLVDTSKGYAVLLRQDALPVTAGLLDVYGQVRGSSRLTE